MGATGLGATWMDATRLECRHLGCHQVGVRWVGVHQDGRHQTRVPPSWLPPGCVHQQLGSTGRDQELLGSIPALPTSGYQPCDPQIICNRVNHVQTCLRELGDMAAKRRQDLEDSRRLWAFFQEMEEAEAWIREKERVLASKGCGRDLSSVLALTGEHKATLGELGGRRASLHQAMQRGEEILAKGGSGPDGVREKMRSVRARWKKLEEAVGLHQQKLQEALGFFQFSAETDDLLAWLQDAYRIASSDDFGHDDYSSQSLLRKHRAVMEDVERHGAAVAALRRQLGALAPEHQRGVEVQIRVVEVEQLYGEVAEVAVLRQQWLRDALAVYRMFSEVRACEVWVDEKEQWLRRMEVPEELDEVEVVQHRCGLWGGGWGSAGGFGGIAAPWGWLGLHVGSPCGHRGVGWVSMLGLHVVTVGLVGSPLGTLMSPWVGWVTTGDFGVVVSPWGWLGLHVGGFGVTVGLVGSPCWVTVGLVGSPLGTLVSPWG